MIKARILSLLISASLVLGSAITASACDVGNGYEMYTNAGLSAPAELYPYWLMAKTSEEELAELEAEAEENFAYTSQYSAEEKALCEQACRAEICQGCTTPIEYIGDFVAYSYCTCSLCCAPEWNGLTYTETVPEEGRTVAVDPTVIPLGTKLLLGYEDGSYRELIAEDTGSGIQGNTLDVFINDHDRASEHGAQIVKVWKEMEK